MKKVLEKTRDKDINMSINKSNILIISLMKINKYTNVWWLKHIIEYKTIHKIVLDPFHF